MRDGCGKEAGVGDVMKAACINQCVYARKKALCTVCFLCVRSSPLDVSVFKQWRLWGVSLSNTSLRVSTYDHPLCRNNTVP